MNAIKLTRTANVRLRSDGIVEVVIRPKFRQTLEDAKENLAAAMLAAGSQRRPFLVDIRQAEMLEPEARHFYGSAKLNDAFTAFALLLHASPLGRMMGNVYMKIARHDVPTKLFTEEVKAIEWLSTYL